MIELPIAAIFPEDPPESFPDVNTALAEPDGLLAIGGDLSAERLLAAYKCGIFPWYSEGEPILWWAPERRAVLFTKEFDCSRSLRKRIRSGYFDVSANQCFSDVIRQCAATRQETGTWITPEMLYAYNELHRLGFAHSIECWRNGELVGGLYGVRLGRVFFGESMFSTVSDASKVALATLVQLCDSIDIPMIDCQQPSAHLSRLGMRLISRDKFSGLLSDLIAKDTDNAAAQDSWIIPPRPSSLPD